MPARAEHRVSSRFFLTRVGELGSTEPMILQGEIEDVLDILDARPSLELDRRSPGSAGSAKFTMEQGHPELTGTYERTGQISRRPAANGTANRYSHSTYREKSVSALMANVRLAAETGNLSRAVMKIAEGVLEQVIDAPNIRRSHKSGVPEGAVFVAARTCNCPRTIREVAVMFGVSDLVVTKGARRVSTAMSCDRRASLTQNKSASPAPFVSRFSEVVSRHLPKGCAFSHTVGDLQTLAHDVASTRQFSDESPALVAAAVILRSAAVKSSQVDGLAKQLGVKASALKKCLKLIVDEGAM